MIARNYKYICNAVVWGVGVFLLLRMVGHLIFWDQVVSRETPSLIVLGSCAGGLRRNTRSGYLFAVVVSMLSVIFTILPDFVWVLSPTLSPAQKFLSFETIAVSALAMTTAIIGLIGIRAERKQELATASDGQGETT